MKEETVPCQQFSTANITFKKYPEFFAPIFIAENLKKMIEHSDVFFVWQRFKLPNT